MNKLWFRRKLYGWGWFPITWEGWLVLLVWVAIFIDIVQKDIQQYTIERFVFIILMVALLLLICFLKGEKPKWQWGRRIEDSQYKN